MDLNDLRNGVTLLSFAIFAGILIWALAPRNRVRFDEAQWLPFEGELPDASRPEARHE
jgi:cytochrome c oxidase cbb3-type subunit IV